MSNKNAKLPKDTSVENVLYIQELEKKIKTMPPGEKKEEQLKILSKIKRQSTVYIEKMRAFLENSQTSSRSASEDSMDAEVNNFDPKYELGTNRFTEFIKTVDDLEEEEKDNIRKKQIEDFKKKMDEHKRIKGAETLVSISRTRKRVPSRSPSTSRSPSKINRSRGGKSRETIKKYKKGRSKKRKH